MGVGISTPGFQRQTKRAGGNADNNNNNNNQPDIWRKIENYDAADAQDIVQS
jgi:hypothetical protein